MADNWHASRKRSTQICEVVPAKHIDTRASNASHNPAPTFIITTNNYNYVLMWNAWNVARMGIFKPGASFMHFAPY